MNEVESAVAMPEAVITKALESGDTEILKNVSRWRIYALYANRKSWRWSLSKHVQAELDLLLDNCRGSL